MKRRKVTTIARDDHTTVRDHENENDRGLRKLQRPVEKVSDVTWCEFRWLVRDGRAAEPSGLSGVPHCSPWPPFTYDLARPQPTWSVAKSLLSMDIEVLLA